MHTRLGTKLQRDETVCRYSCRLRAPYAQGEAESWIRTYSVRVKAGREASSCGFPLRHASPSATARGVAGLRHAKWSFQPRPRGSGGSSARWAARGAAARALSWSYIVAQRPCRRPSDCDSSCLILRRFFSLFYVPAPGTDILGISSCLIPTTNTPSTLLRRLPDRAIHQAANITCTTPHTKLSRQ